jgi:WD40 repeat protein
VSGRHEDHWRIQEAARQKQWTQARLWAIATSDPDGVLTGHTDTVLAVAFSPDGSLLATASCDDTARLWSSPASARILAGHSGGVWGWRSARTALARIIEPVKSLK